MAARRLANWLLPLWLAWVAAFALASAPASGVAMRIDRADFVLDGSRIPPTAVAWQPVALPDNWSVSRSGKGGSGWYRIRFVAPDVGADALAIYLPRFGMNARVFLGAQPIGPHDDGLGDAYRSWNRPLLLSFSGHALEPGENLVYVRVQSATGEVGGLAPVHVGTLDSLVGGYRLRWFLQILMPMLSSATLSLLGLFTAVLWYRFRDPLDGYFSLIAAAAALRMTDYYAVWLPLDETAAQLAVAVLVLWFVILVAVFSRHLLRLTRPFWERPFAWTGIALAMVAVVAPAVHGDAARVVAGAIHGLALAMGLFAIGWLVSRARRDRPVQFALMVVAALIGFGFGVHDMLQRWGVVSSTHSRMSHLGVPLLVLTMAWLLAIRYIEAIRRVLGTNEELGRLVGLKTAELERHHEELLRRERDAARLGERENLMRDMHDGLGAHLTLAIGLLEPGRPDIDRVRAQLQDCMLDLRLLIDSVTPRDDDLGSVLGNLRYRLEPVLTSVGIRLHWQAGDIGTGIAMTPQHVFHILCIFQEAFVNVVKHSNADLVRFEAFNDPQRDNLAVIRLVDNGTRVPATAGQGLVNMATRAEAIGGRLAVDLQPGHMSIELDLPPPRADHPTANGG